MGEEREPARDSLDAREQAIILSRAYQGPDRRKRPTPPISRYSFFGGRRGRAEPIHGGEGGFVDLYDARLAFLLLVFFVFTVIDSVSTLIYLEKGGIEVNPVARWMIEQGPDFFILTKGILSGVCILFVMVHKNFKYSRLAITMGFLFYLGLTIYHIVLQIKAL